ncbi:DinB family protein [Oceanobacillus piezotolerans]|uniref:DinB family protein n=1 Tax=Oceanobacillus piezotolerans TaxID=2448030 RepID=A0A498DL34_9BACI|nr:DinB family protein [Oceanobacillus piezotolerans]RLL47750.1 DinB family protein [Oceanobacillus piezotolerans]
MSVLKQFNLARTSLLTFIQDLDNEALDYQSAYFDNTIRWHIGNTLLMDEKLLFVNQKKSQHIPKEYAELFSSDVKVEDWTVEAPSLEELMSHLVNQQNRVNTYDELFWKSDVKFKVPHGHIETHGDLLIMLAHREAEMLGKIKAMKQQFDRK